MGYLYCLTFPNGKRYIGITKRTVEVRFKQHKRDSERGSTFPLHRAWKKYGDPQCKTLAVIEDFDLRATERRAIAVFGTLSPGGYNCTDGGDGGEMSPETRHKQSVARKGKPKTASHRAAIAQAHFGREWSAEHLENVAIAQRQRDPATRKDLSKFWCGRKQSPEHIAKRVAAYRKAVEKRNG